jgi:hypothetical protein
MRPNSSSCSGSGGKKSFYAKRNDKEMNIRCEICMDAEWEDDDNKIVLCDGCNSACHQNCYFIEEEYENSIKNPEDKDWFC